MPSRGPRTVLTDEQVAEIKEKALAEVPLYKLADQYKISYKRVRQIAQAAHIAERNQALREGRK